MATLIKFGSFSCLATTKKIILPESYSFSASYNTEENERTKKKPTVSRKGPALRAESFDVILNSQLGVSVQATVNNLIKICESGKAYYLYRNKKKIGKYKWQLNSISGDGDLDKNGILLSCSMSLEFTEYIKKTGSSKEDKAAKKRKK